MDDILSSLTEAQSMRGGAEFNRWLEPHLITYYAQQLQEARRMHARIAGWNMKTEAMRQRKAGYESSIRLRADGLRRHGIDPDDLAAVDQLAGRPTPDAKEVGAALFGIIARCGGTP